MPHSSSPELDDGYDENGRTGTVLFESGGRSSDAARQAQLEALHQASSEQVAARQSALAEEARALEEAQRTEDQRRRALLHHRRQQREQAQSLMSTFVVSMVLLSLLYMAFRKPVSPP
jgi:hypothetical protein